MNLIARHLRGLTDFSGRENREPFWLWLLILYVCQTALSMVITVPLMVRMMGAMQALQGQDPAYLNEHPEIAQRLMMQAMVPMFRFILVFAIVLGLIQIAMVAAAVTRRLHDTDRSGWWAAPMPVIQLATLAAYCQVLPRFFETIATIPPGVSPEQTNDAMAAIMPGFALVGLLGFVGFAFMVLMIVLLCLRGTVGPNRYGEDLLPPPVVWTPPPQAWAPPPPPPPARIVGPWGDRPPGS